MPELTPLMKQYFSIKEKYKDAIVFFRLGDFYEMFGEDAENTDVRCPVFCIGILYIETYQGGL